MKFKRMSLVLITATLVLLSGWLNLCLGATVQVNAGIGQPILAAASGVALPDGVQVELGTFAQDFELDSALGDLTALRGAWESFGKLNIRTIFGEAGRLAGEVFAASPEFSARQIYWWVAFGEAEAGIFTSSLPNWYFPVAGSVLPSTLVSASDIDTIIQGALKSDKLMTAPTSGTPAKPALLTVDIERTVISTELRWSGLDSRKHIEVVYSEALQPDSWESITSGVGLTSFSDTDPKRLANPLGFYRVSTVDQ